MQEDSLSGDGGDPDALLSARVLVLGDELETAATALRDRRPVLPGRRDGVIQGCTGVSGG